MTASDAERAQIRTLATVAFDRVPAVWPIGGFIAANPLGGFEQLPFAQAVAEMRARTGARGFLPESDYRKLFAEGEISEAALDASLDDALGERGAQTRTVGGRTLAIRDVVRASLLSGAVPYRPQSGAPRIETVAEIADARCGTTLATQVDERTIFWCSAFLDEGEAAWPMPHRELGLYNAWRRLARYESGDAKHAALPEEPEDAIASALRQLGVARGDRRQYLSRHALRLPGWAGMTKWRATKLDDPLRPALVDYLAIRLWYEAALVAAFAEREGIEPTAAAFAARFGNAGAVRDTPLESDVLARLAARLEIPATDDGFEPDDARWLLDAAATLGDEARGSVWLGAHERTARGDLLTQLAQSRAATRAERAADIVFCIDVRSEGLRRHLEDAGPYRTRGFAGFFGLPIALRALDSDWDQQACPVLIAPKHTIVEYAPDAAAARRQSRGRQLVYELGRVLDEVKSNVASPFVLFESAGAFFAVALAGRTLLPSLFARVRQGLARAIAPPARSEFITAKEPHSDDTVGFTADERIFFAETSLALMDLRADFPPLVVFTGHGSTTENNPFEASLDCGACAGYRGGPNARILAALLNRDDVRAGLRERGIDIPDATHFAAAEHDTVTDRVQLLDTHALPAALRAAANELQRALDVAGTRLARERLGALERAPSGSATASAERRSRDWAQVRPEWGLAGNSAFVIAPRSFSEGAHLGPHAFLHDYDIAGDDDGALLEVIMTAPLIVAQWINSHYYFATVDNERYGSGTKVVHNVVGRIGVMAGNRGDLRPGLPLQSLADAKGWYHRPLRLLAVVAAPRARIEAVVSRNAILRRLFGNEWIALTAWDPQTESFWERTAAGIWRPPFPEPYGITSNRVEKGNARWP